MSYPLSHWLDMEISKRSSFYLLWFYICVLLLGFQASVVSCKDFALMDEIEKINKNTGASYKPNPLGNAFLRKQIWDYAKLRMQSQLA